MNGTAHTATANCLKSFVTVTRTGIHLQHNQLQAMSTKSPTNNAFNKNEENNIPYQFSSFWDWNALLNDLHTVLRTTHTATHGGGWHSHYLQCTYAYTHKQRLDCKSTSSYTLDCISPCWQAVACTKAGIMLWGYCTTTDWAVYASTASPSATDCAALGKTQTEKEVQRTVWRRL